LIGGRITVSWCPTVRGGRGSLAAGGVEDATLPVVAGSLAAVLDPAAGFLVASLGLSGLPSRNGREYLKLCAPGAGNTVASGGTE
jgi:hypothetical protein